MFKRLTALLLALTCCASQAGEHVSTDEADDSPSAAPLFSYQGKSFTVRDLSARMQQLHGSLLEEHYGAMRTLIDEMLFDVYVEREAARQKRAVREVGIELLAVPEPTESEVQLFYNQIQSRINLPFEQISPRLRKQLKRQRRLQNRAQLIARLKKEGKFELLLQAPPPALAIINTAGRPARGQPSAPITIVEFADFQCSNCKRAVSIFDDLLKKYPQDIKLVFMNLPIKSSKASRQIAHGGVCAQNQGKFWAYHDAAYESQSVLSSPSAEKLAKQIGVSMEQFEQCMQDRGTRIKVQAAIDEARRLGVTDTPTIFVDGRPFPSNHLLKDLGAYIEKKKAGAG